MTVRDQLLNTIVRGEVRVIAISGAADLGKSQLAYDLVERINFLGVSAVCLGLDSYLLPRAIRKEAGYSGYDPRAHDLSRAREDIERLLRGEQVEYHEYIHETGQQSAASQLIQPATKIVIEGLHAMHSTLRDLVGLSIFLHTTDDRLQDLRLAADLSKRRLRPSEAEANAAAEMANYYHYIEPYKAECTTSIFVDESFHLSVA